MLRLQRFGQLVLQGFCGDSRCVGHSSVDGGVRACGERKRDPLDVIVRAEEIAAASAQDGEGGGAGEHQVWSEGRRREDERR